MQDTKLFGRSDEDTDCVLAIDRAAFNQGENAKYDFSISGGGYRSNNSCKRSRRCLLQKTKGGDGMNGESNTEYIVRRLTPMECCRLQGFPDGWAEIDPKEDFTDEEYEFWLNVRKTFAEINGKQTKEWDKRQMLTWYNKLHTDSAEYKMWGNGIALPCALFVMKGIAKAL